MLRSQIQTQTLVGSHLWCIYQRLGLKQLGLVKEVDRKRDSTFFQSCLQVLSLQRLSQINECPQCMARQRVAGLSLLSPRKKDKLHAYAIGFFEDTRIYDWLSKHHCRKDNSNAKYKSCKKESNSCIKTIESEVVALRNRT